MRSSIIATLTSFVAGFVIAEIAGHNLHVRDNAVQIWNWLYQSTPVMVAISAIGLGALVITALMLSEEDGSEKRKELYSKPKASDVELKWLNSEFDRQVRDLIQFIANQLELNSKHVDAMSKAEIEISNSEDIVLLRAAVEHLIAEHKAAQQSMRDIQAQCERAQSKIVELRTRLDSAEYEATTDQLTGIANRRKLLDVLEAIVAQSHRNQTPLCFVMADIDHFKKINDTYGHAVGDEVLALFAQVMRQNIRSTDAVGRYGGEEFAMVLPGATSGDAADIIRRLQEHVRATNFGAVPKVTASFGIAAVTGRDTSAALIERADRMLYEAKRAGRDCYKMETERSVQAA